MGLRELIAGALLVYGSSQIPVYAQDSAPEPPKPEPAVHEKGTEGVDRAVYEAPKSDEPVSRELKRWERQLEALEVRVTKIEEKAEKRDEPPKYSKGLIGDYVSLARNAQKKGLIKEAEQTYRRILEFDIRHEEARRALNLVTPYITWSEAQDGDLEKKIACLRRIVKDDYGADCEFYFLVSDKGEYSRKEKRILEEQEKQAIDSLIRMLSERAQYKFLPYEAKKDAALSKLREWRSFGGEVPIYLFGEDVSPVNSPHVLCIDPHDVFEQGEKETKKDLCYISAILQIRKNNLKIDGEKFDISRGDWPGIQDLYGHLKSFEMFGFNDEREREIFLHNYKCCLHSLAVLYPSGSQTSRFYKTTMNFIEYLNKELFALGYKIVDNGNKYDFQKIPDIETDAEKVSKK